MGEASNPGPSFCTAEALAQHTRAVKVSIASADRVSCRKSMDGGHGNANGREENYGLTTITANVACWRSAIRFIEKRIKTEVILVQGGFKLVPQNRQEVNLE